MDFLFAQFPVSGLQFAVLFAGLTAAYIIFGIAGFGTAMVAAPMLANFMPLSAIVPMLALLDFWAATTNVARDARRADTRELKRLVPLMVIGSIVGAAILLLVQPDFLLLLLGLFAIGYALYALSGGQARRSFSPRAVYPFGLLGGVFSALFGSGGFIYAIYLASRLPDKTTFRVTQSTLIGLATLTRVLLFLIAGVYADTNLLWTALLLTPAMLLGTWLGRRITVALSREAFLRVVAVLVLGSGIALVARYALS